MNFLAHIYLSGNNEEILVGNFIGDAVKGRDFSRFPNLVRKGLSLHRFIDSFTDTHPVVHKSKFLLSSRYHKYAGIVVDILYDYFLSNAWSTYSNEPIREFIYRNNDILFQHSYEFPKEVKRLFPFFILNNWLETYTTLEGIGKVLSRMARYTTLPNESDFAIQIVKDHFEELNDHFQTFFPEIIDAVSERYDIHFSVITDLKEYMPRA